MGYANLKKGSLNKGETFLLDSKVVSSPIKSKTLSFWDDTILKRNLIDGRISHHQSELVALRASDIEDCAKLSGNFDDDIHKNFCPEESYNMATSPNRLQQGSEMTNFNYNYHYQSNFQNYIGNYTGPNLMTQNWNWFQSGNLNDCNFNNYGYNVNYVSDNIVSSQNTMVQKFPRTEQDSSYYRRFCGPGYDDDFTRALFGHNRDAFVDTLCHLAEWQLSQAGVDLDGINNSREVSAIDDEGLNQNSLNFNENVDSGSNFPVLRFTHADENTDPDSDIEGMDESRDLDSKNNNNDECI